jgi:hypothetical protein
LFYCVWWYTYDYMVYIRKLRIRPLELQQLIRLQKFQNYYAYIGLFLFNFRRVFLFLHVFLRLGYISDIFLMQIKFL